MGMNPVVAMLIGIIVMMLLIIFTKMHAFPSLIISAILIAFPVYSAGALLYLYQKYCRPNYYRTLHLMKLLLR